MRWILVGLVLAGCAPSGRMVVSGVTPQPFCTRTLGVAECFADPGDLPDQPRPLAETPVRMHVECDPWWRKGGLVCLAEQPAPP